MQTCFLLLQLAVLTLAVTAQSWEEERLSWLVVTKPDAQGVQLNCTSNYIYPFSLLNDSSVIGALGSQVKRIWWVLPDGTRTNETYSDEHRLTVDRGVGLLFRKVVDRVQGLYHCAVEACRWNNGTQDGLNCNTTVYYYKRGLNLYGADIYGGSAWEKYKRNTLIGSLTAGAFLVLIAGYALLDHFGIFARCAATRSNAVDSLGGSEEKGPTVAAAAEATDDPTEMKAASSTPAAVERSRASLRSRRSDKVTPTTEETAA